MRALSSVGLAHFRLIGRSWDLPSYMCALWQLIPLCGPQDLCERSSESTREWSSRHLPLPFGVDPDLGPLHVVNVLLLSHSGHARGPRAMSLRAFCARRVQHIDSWVFRAILVGRPVKNGDAHLKHTATEKTAAVPVAEAESTKVPSRSL